MKVRASVKKLQAASFRLVFTDHRGRRKTRHIDARRMETSRKDVQPLSAEN